ncbi:MAG: hypothetical protein WC352_04695 [Candidatus Omnitrophota bacterium]|jgi:hypothetical protein
MKCPAPDRAFETFIKINPGDDCLQVLGQKVKPLIEELTLTKKIGWYCFLVHDRNSGVPTAPDDDSSYWHLRLELAPQIEPEALASSLPSYCLMTRKIFFGDEIGGIDKNLLKNGNVMDAWRILGEQSEWMLRMLDIHTGEGLPLRRQVAQFLHYFANMAQMHVK